MKKIYVFLFLTPVLIFNSLCAQGNFEIFGLRSWAFPRPYYSDKGFGGGMNLLGRSIPLTGKDNLHPVNFQFGSGFYVSGLGTKKFRDIPLNAPETGNAVVKLYDVVFGFNLFFRLSAPNATTGRKPYLDFTGGLRSMSSNMTIIPNLVTAGYDNKTNSTLYTAGGWCYGIGAGMQVKLSENTNLDFELLWNYSSHSRDLVNLKSAQKTSDGIYYDLKQSPNSVIMLKVGFSFRTEGSRGHCNCNNGSRGGYHNPSYHTSTHTSGGGGHSSSVHISTGGGHSSGVHTIAK
jgi:hypothetical protein